MAYRHLLVLVEDLGLVSSTHLAGHNHLGPQLQRDLTNQASCMHTHICMHII